MNTSNINKSNTQSTTTMTVETIEEPRRDPVFGQGTIIGDIVALVRGDKKLI